MAELFAQIGKMKEDFNLVNQEVEALRAEKRVLLETINYRRQSIEAAEINRLNHMK